ncbi:uncharacterized protein LOC121695049 isoform X3 [Alosa sapidissima]|uniref:uncharacterized protein LOC121695049 isoform X3 n=1 Tax=Alosa sapidissima TaxID=34773 RepID=UPI001C097FCC|nr:uncharacterized protein LOC121695049 isoform X3 [Alosa sapidissima]
MARLQTEMMCVFLMLMLSGVSDGNTCICDATKSITCHGVQGEPLYLQRLHFTAMNGTISINPATKGDSGTYQVEIINDDKGVNVANITIQIIIQDAHSTVTSTNTQITVNDNPKMETPVYVIRASACLGVILLCGAVGVLCVCQRRTHTHKPGQTTKCNET